MGTPSVAFRLTRISFRDSKLPTKRKDSPRHTTRHLHSERLANSFRSAEGLLVPKSSLKTIPAHTSTGGSTFPDTEAVYSRIRLLQRQQYVAVSEEDYAQAAQIRDTLKATVEGLTSVQQVTIHETERLKSTNKEEIRSAIQTLSKCGCDYALPELAELLYNSEFQADAETAMCNIFMKSTKEESNALMEKGQRYVMQSHTLQDALDIFNDMIQGEPSFAEGFNKRATVLYLLARFEESIEDCKVVVEMQPYHYPALAGMGLCYYHLGRYKEAVKSFEKALNVNPGLSHIRRLAEQLKQDNGPE